MELNQAKERAIKILTQNGFKIQGDTVSYYESISVEKMLNVRNELSNILFLNEKGNDSTYQLIVGETPEKLILSEIEV